MFMQREVPADVMLLLEPLLDLADLRQMRAASRTFAAMFAPAVFAQFNIKQADPLIDGITPRVDQLLSNTRLAHFVRRVTVHYEATHHSVCGMA
jgi:hypothetical protein